MKYMIIIEMLSYGFWKRLDAKNYEEYLEKYSGASSERSHFIAVCGFFELSGVLVSYGLID